MDTLLIISNDIYSIISTVNLNIEEQVGEAVV